MASTSSSSSNTINIGVVNKIERAHQLYRDGRYEEAFAFYTEALSAAKSTPQKIALHSNRAACFLKLHNFKKAAEECTSVLELDHNHTGALMLRAQTLVTLKEYNSALFDVNRLIDLNPSSEVYRNLQARLKTQLSLAPIPEDDAELEEEEDEDKAELQEDKEERERKAIEEREEGGKQVIEAVVPNEQKAEFNGVTPKGEVTAQNRTIVKSSEDDSSGWQAIPKPKGHSQLDYSRWDRVQDDSSEDDDEDDDNDSQPQYRFRVRTVGVRAVK